MSVPADRVPIGEAGRVGGMPIPKEYLPSSLNEGAKARYSLIVERKRRRWLPNNNQSPSVTIGGSNPSSQTEVNIPLQQAGGLLDTPSVRLNYRLSLTSSDALALPFLENCSLPWKSLKVQAGGVDIETWDHHAKQLQRVKEGSMSRPYAQAQYSFTNDIRDRVGALGDYIQTTAISSDAVVYANGVRDLQDISGATYSDLLAGINASLPLFHMGFFSQRAYYPLSLAPVNVVATTETTTGAVLCGRQDLAAGTGLVVQDISVSGVCPIPNSNLMKMYQKVQLDGDKPFIMPIDTVMIQQRTAYQQASDGTETNVVFNAARYHIKDLRFWLEYPGQRTSVHELKTAAPSALAAPSANMDVYVEVAGRTVPEQHLNKDVELYNAMCESYNTEDSVSHPNLLPRAVWANATFPTATDLDQKFSVGAWQLGFNLEEYLGEQGSRTGVDLVQNSTINLHGRFGYPNAGNTTDFIWFMQARYTRVLELKGNLLESIVN